MTKYRTTGDAVRQQQKNAEREIKEATYDGIDPYADDDHETLQNAIAVALLVFAVIIIVVIF